MDVVSSSEYLPLDLYGIELLSGVTCRDNDAGHSRQPGPYDVHRAVVPAKIRVSATDRLLTQRCWSFAFISSKQTRPRLDKTTMDAPETGERALSVGAYPLLVIFHLFPLHAPITLWLMDAPFGKFSWDSVLNLPAGIAWAVMECVSVSSSCSSVIPSSCWQANPAARCLLCDA